MMLTAIVSFALSTMAGIVVNGPTVRPAAGGGATYLVKQGFEGTGYDNGETWTETSGTPNEDYTATVLVGSQSLYMDGRAASQATDSPVWPDTTEVWGYFKLHILTLPGTTRDITRFFHDGTQASSSSIQLTSTGQIRITNGSTASTATVGTMSTGVTYDIFWYLKAGSGADGIGWVAFSTDGTIGTGNNLSTRNTMNGTEAFDQWRVYSQFSTSGTEWIGDKLRVDDVTIGDNPE